MAKITDQFKVGDRVKWVTITQVRKGYDIKQHEGLIDEIRGSKAMIKRAGRYRRQKVSLFELEVIR